MHHTPLMIPAVMLVLCGNAVDPRGRARRLNQGNVDEARRNLGEGGRRTGVDLQPDLPSSISDNDLRYKNRRRNLISCNCGVTCANGLQSQVDIPLKNTER